MKKFLIPIVLIFSVIAACNNTGTQGNNPSGKSRANDPDQFSGHKTHDNQHDSTSNNSPGNTDNR
jgi:hypothetical protein